MSAGIFYTSPDRYTDTGMSYILFGPYIITCFTRIVEVVMQVRSILYRLYQNVNVIHLQTLFLEVYCHVMYYRERSTCRVMCGYGSANMLSCNYFRRYRDAVYCRYYIYCRHAVTFNLQILQLAAKYQQFRYTRKVTRFHVETWNTSKN